MKSKEEFVTAFNKLAGEKYQLPVLPERRELLSAGVDYRLFIGGEEKAEAYITQLYRDYAESVLHDAYYSLPFYATKSGRTEHMD
jgi:hypothetical protein